MTKMLASVGDAHEAQIALSGGADIIDLADLAAAEPIASEAIAETVAAIGDRGETSAAAMDLSMDPAAMHARVQQIAATGVDYVRVGLFPSAQVAACIEAIASLAGQTKLIGVLFADRQPDFALLDVLARHGFNGAMIDIAGKAGERLFDYLPPEDIPSIVERSIKVGFAGGLEAPDVPRLLLSAPDFLGFSSALRARPDGPIDREAVIRIRALIPGERGEDGFGSVDYRLLATRRHVPHLADAEMVTDKVFVRDFVLPVRIGAYSFEHGHTQKVRFDVTADVLRAASGPEDMRGVFSYDIIMDGIRATVARGHVELSEALAEQVAALVLEDPRVMRVTVRVEKLELGAGGVGVEIERKRAKASTLRPGFPAAAEKGGPR